MSTVLANARRIRNGQPVQAEVYASYQDTGHGLPTLWLFSDWSIRKGDFRTRDKYVVEEIPAAGGRAFLLHRSLDAVMLDIANAKPGDAGVPIRYGCFLGHDGYECECHGFQRHSRCKHIDALAALMSGGFIDEPCADRKPDPIDQMIEAPF
ncbi:MAG TPA: hypothetical protein VKE74_13895 [Gemmataceae bacterium]|nr:hypothetical protein [Gemmataceae bacterium]